MNEFTPKTDAAFVRDIAENCMAVRYRIASRDITRCYDQRLRPLGLRITQLSVLVCIAGCESMLPSAIGEILHLDRSTLSRTLERLRQRGWVVEGDGDGGDGRSRPVKLSDSGWQIIREAYPIWKEAQESLQANMVP